MKALILGLIFGNLSLSLIAGVPCSNYNTCSSCIKFKNCIYVQRFNSDFGCIKRDKTYLSYRRVFRTPTRCKLLDSELRSITLLIIETPVSEIYKANPSTSPKFEFSNKSNETQPEFSTIMSALVPTEEIEIATIFSIPPDVGDLDLETTTIASLPIILEAEENSFTTTKYEITTESNETQPEFSTNKPTLVPTEEDGFTTIPTIPPDVDGSQFKTTTIAPAVKILEEEYKFTTESNGTQLEFSTIMPALVPTEEVEIATIFSIPPDVSGLDLETTTIASLPKILEEEYKITSESNGTQPELSTIIPAIVPTEGEGFATISIISPDVGGPEFETTTSTSSHKTLEAEGGTGAHSVLPPARLAPKHKQKPNRKLRGHRKLTPINKKRLERKIKQKACELAYYQKIYMYQTEMGSGWFLFSIRNPMLRKDRQCDKLMRKSSLRF